MPLIGTGQAGGSWSAVKQLIYENVANRGVEVWAYVLEDAPMPEDIESETAQLELL
jgi:glucose dehydrogenase